MARKMIIWKVNTQFEKFFLILILWIILEGWNAELESVYFSNLTLNDAGFLEEFFLEKWSLSYQIFFQMKI